jgi:competence protein ComEA
MKRQGVIFLSGLLLCCMLTVNTAYPRERKSKRSTTATSSASTTKVEINSASPAELNALPGIGPATTEKIIAGRPYTSVNDFSPRGSLLSWNSAL